MGYLLTLYLLKCDSKKMTLMYVLYHFKNLLSIVNYFLFFQASFEDDARIAFLTLLEYEPNEVREKIAEKTGSKPANAQAHEQGKYVLMILFF